MYELYTEVRDGLKKYEVLRSLAKSRLDKANDRLEKATHALRVTEEAQRFIALVAGTVQLRLEQAVSDLVNKALTGVFEDESYDFVMRFIPKAGKVEVEFVYVTKDGQELNPLEDSGIGTVDVTAFALRVSLWHVASKHARPILLLDEPFKNLSKEYRSVFLGLIKQIARDTGMQFIIVTHQYDLVSIADNVITVTKPSRKGPSIVECEVVK